MGGSTAHGQHYLVGAAGYTGPTDNSFVGFTDGQSIELRYGLLTTVDTVVVGATAPALPPLDGRIDQSYERRFNGCMDIGIWMDDFVLQSSPTPATSSDPATPC